jgi:chitodextrinase
MMSGQSRRAVGLVSALGGLLLATLLPITAIAAGPIASSTFGGVEDPLSESGAWAALTSLSPNGGRFQKGNGAFPDRLGPDHAGARTTAAVPSDHYSEIVVGHIGSLNINNVGPIVRVQSSGTAIDSHYLWWVSGPNGLNYLYRIDATGTSYVAAPLIPTSSVMDGDRLRLIARGPVIYGIKNGVRDFIYNYGADTKKYSGGTTGILAYTNGNLADATIASWSTAAAPASSGTAASSNFIGAENPLDEGDRWYPLPGYSGFRKTGGLATGRDSGHNASGVWSIAPPPKQFSEVTLGTVASGGGGPIVRIDRTNSGQTGWLLFLVADNPGLSGIYKMNPDGTFVAVRTFTPLIVPGDTWRLAADGNILEVFHNGASQFTYTTDGSYAAGDVGIEAYTPAFTFAAWQGGASAGSSDTIPPTAPANATATPSGSSQVDLSWTASTDNVGVTGYRVERCQGASCTSFSQIASVSGTSYSDTGLAASTTYSYRVRASDAAGNLSAYSNVASATTQSPADTTPPTAPTNLIAAPIQGQISLAWTGASDNVGVTGYRIERCAGLACATFVEIGTSVGTNYGDNQVTPNTSYTYRVRAQDAAGNLGPYSNTATATATAF